MVLVKITEFVNQIIIDMKSVYLLIITFYLFSKTIYAQTEREVIPLNKNLVSVNVEISEEPYLGRESVKVFDKGENTEVKFAKIENLDFKNGMIEIDVAGKPLEGASEQARGFVGIAFRISNNNSRFECIYLRPTNGRADDQVRRNHSVQYISFPDFPWYKLRNDFPEKYETYVDLVPGEWTTIRIEIKGERAKLYVHGNTQPTLIVNDLKLGPDIQGGIGLWIGPGTEAHFSNLVIENIE
jgi:hypothetical protein